MAGPGLGGLGGAAGEDPDEDLPGRSVGDLARCGGVLCLGDNGCMQKD